MVCLPTPEADDSSIHLPLCRYPAEQGLNIRNNDDDDKKEDYVMMMMITREWVVTAANCVCDDR